jgi:pyrroline-5-carboxylate reductase
LVRADFCSPREILAGEPNAEARNMLQQELSITVTAENAEVAEQTNVILIGVKPGVVLNVLDELAALIESKLVISLAAGVRFVSMEPIAEARFMRAMTNTPSAICRGATALARGTRTTGDDILDAKEIFSALGLVLEVEEEQIDAVTALSGSGPAFVYMVIEALAAGGTKCGLPSDVALALATQTVLGAAELARTTGCSPEELRKMVVTPGGTTSAGLAVMEKNKTTESISAAVEAAAARGQEMARESSADSLGKS